MISLDNGWFIAFCPKPIPTRFAVDWDFWHEAQDPSDGPDGLSGHAKDLADAKEQIKDIESEHVYFNGGEEK